MRREHRAPYTASRAALLGYDFPGNEDELDAIVERAVARCSGSRVALAELGPLGAPVRASGNPLDATLERVEQRALRRALERAAGIKSEAARLLGIPRTTLLDKLRRHGLDPSCGTAPRSARRVLSWSRTRRTRCRRTEELPAQGSTRSAFGARLQAPAHGDRRDQ